MEGIKKYFFLLIIAMAIFAFFSPKAQAAIENPDFETGDLTGWTSAGQADVQSDIVHSGSFAAYIGTVDLERDDENDFTGANGDYIYNNYISQTFDVTGMESLNLYYNVYTWDSAPLDDPAFVIKINGISVFSLKANDISNDSTGWQLFTYDISEYTDPITLAIYAGNTDDTLFQSWAYVDDVSLTAPPPAPVPLPSTIAMLLPGLLFGFGLCRKRITLS
ncbi:hypothetical protein [Desulfovulcanus sp.]